MADEFASSAARGLVLVTDRYMVAELSSPCPQFRVITFKVCGKQLYEAFRVAGEGTLYSVATTDLDELYAVVHDACSRACRTT
ncbi:MAG TPA: hypothetical protein VF070_33185 [Streptosporangiaceae bacterium]